jgi:hypothetical protein
VYVNWSGIGPGPAQWEAGNWPPELRHVNWSGIGHGPAQWEVCNWLPELRHGELIWDWTRPGAVRSRQLTAWTTARRTDLGLDTARRSEKPTTDCLNYGTANWSGIGHGPAQWEAGNWPPELRNGELIWDWTRPGAVRSRQLTAWTTERRTDLGLDTARRSEKPVTDLLNYGTAQRRSYSLYNDACIWSWSLRAMRKTWYCCWDIRH